MTDGQRNTRTLIVCFTVAYLVLIPLRMVEFRRNEMEQFLESGSVVLGEQSQVVLPKADFGGLEPPYDEIERVERERDCIDEVGARDIMRDYIRYLDEQDVSGQELEGILKEMDSVQKQICQ